MQKSKGFTLIELVLVIIILSVIAAIGSKVISAGFNSYFTNQNVTSANEQLRVAIERMTRDIHAINSSGSITTATGTRLTFTDVNGNSVDYQIASSQLTLNNNVLVSGIVTASSSFAYLNKNGATTATLANIRYVIITLVSNLNGVNYTVRTTVNTMNYQ